jgi:glycosyltransferase involved in cell wall biosynthesis
MYLGVILGIALPLIVIWAVMIRQLAFALTHFRFQQRVTPKQMITELPSVSVCIPARNEMHVMTECLESVLASTYPKLEVIVLDDRSEDTTSILVKAFARDGVRFVEGKKLPPGWLGKNYALQELLGEASGRYVFYMDVDTRIQPDTIEQMVAYMQIEKVAMVSVLPRREDGWRASVLFSPLRYFWEIMFHRRTAPATASNAWMIERKVLADEFNGFHDIKIAIQPETRLSSQLMPQNRYRFLISSTELGVSYAKKWLSQAETSIRLLFPLLGKSIGLSALSLLGLLTLLTPFILLGEAFYIGWTGFQTVAAAIAAAYLILYGVYASHLWRRGWWLGMLLWPIILIQEFILIVFSIEQYLMKTVSWKGRPVAVVQPDTPQR